MNDTGSLRRLGAVTNGPLPDLIGAGCEEAAQVHDLPHAGDDLGKCRVDSNLLELFLHFGLGLEPRQALLQRHGDGEDGISLGVLLQPLGDLGKVLVLLADVVLLREIDQVDDGLRSQEEERVDDLDLSPIRSAFMSHTPKA